MIRETTGDIIVQMIKWFCNVICRSITERNTWRWSCYILYSSLQTQSSKIYYLEKINKEKRYESVHIGLVVPCRNVSDGERVFGAPVGKPSGSAPPPIASWIECLICSRCETVFITYIPMLLARLKGANYPHPFHSPCTSRLWLLSWVLKPFILRH